MNNIEGIKSINFFDKNVTAFDEGKPTKYKKTTIEMLIDPGKVCEGNFHFGSHNLQIIKKVEELLNDTLSIDTKKFMAPYDLVIYEVVTVKLDSTWKSVS